jgi:hypothetical protein
MVSVPNLLLVVAFVLFVLAALGLPAGRFNLLAAGLAAGFSARSWGQAFSAERPEPRNHATMRKIVFA